MVFSLADLSIIETYFVEKKWRGAEISSKFPGKKWKSKSVNYAIRKLEKTGNISPTYNRPPLKVTPELEEKILELAESQEENPGSHLSQRKIAQAIVKDYTR